jgi:flagellar biosynthesis/type III secretory pathway protein FliH
VRSLSAGVGETMTSSRDFRPVWPQQQPSEFVGLSLPDIQVPTSNSRTAGDHGTMPLPELAGAMAEHRTADATVTENRAAVERAYQDGFTEGLQQGTAQTYEKIAPALEALSGMVQCLEQARADLSRDTQQNIYALALAITRHLIQREVKTDPTIVRDLVHQALELAPHDVTVEVRLNPDDLAALSGHLDRLTPGGRPLHVQWIPDAALDRGSFLLETPLRVVDGRTDDVLRALYERLSHE